MIGTEIGTGTGIRTRTEIGARTGTGTGTEIGIRTEGSAAAAEKGIEGSTGTARSKRFL